MLHTVHPCCLMLMLACNVCVVGDPLQQEEEDGQAEASHGNGKKAGAEREGGLHAGLCSYPALA